MLHFLIKRKEKKERNHDRSQEQTARLIQRKRECGSAAAASKKGEGLRYDKQLSSWLCNWRFFLFNTPTSRKSPSGSKAYRDLHCCLWPYFSWFYWVSRAMTNQHTVLLGLLSSI